MMKPIKIIGIYLLITEHILFACINKEDKELGGKNSVFLRRKDRDRDNCRRSSCILHCIVNCVIVTVEQRAE
jgi:hypothetical protein